MCGARNLGEALRRIAEGAAMIRTKGEAGTGVYREGGVTEKIDFEILSQVTLWRQCGMLGPCRERSVCHKP